MHTPLNQKPYPKKEFLLKREGKVTAKMRHVQKPNKENALCKCAMQKTPLEKPTVRIRRFQKPSLPLAVAFFPKRFMAAVRVE